MLTQLLTNRNNEKTSGNHDREEENLNKDTSEGEHSKETSSIDVDVIKDIQAQITCLSQQDELKTVGMTCPYPLEWDSVPYPPKFNPLTLHLYDGKSLPNQYIYYFRS